MSSKIQIVGFIISILHVLFLTTMITLILVSHTIYTALWFKVILFLTLFLIVVQHIILGTCFVSIFEKKYIGSETAHYDNIIEKFLSLFNVSIKEYYDVSLAVEITATAFLGLEILSIFCSRLNGLGH
jgi:hypothetical protein